MEVTPTWPPIRLDLCDAALLVAFAVLVAVYTRQASLLFADGAVSLAAAWLFDFWDLLLAQVPTRAVGLMALYGPAWVLRWALGPAAETYVVVAHILYFGVPLLLWLVIRAVQSHPAFARLYLCLALMLVFYPSELIVGLGIWLVWAAIVAKPGRSRAAVVLVTAGFAVPLAFTHPATGLISLLYMLTGGLLAAAGRPFPRQALIAAAAMTALLLCAFLVTDALLPPTNPTVTMVLATSRYFYIDPVWMAATLTVYPLLAVLSLLMLIPKPWRCQRALARTTVLRAVCRCLRPVVCRQWHQSHDLDICASDGVLFSRAVAGVRHRIAGGAMARGGAPPAHAFRGSLYWSWRRCPRALTWRCSTVPWRSDCPRSSSAPKRRPP